jgi:hypothetical protein
VEGEEGVAEARGRRSGRRRGRERRRNRARGGALLGVWREAGEERVEGERRRVADAEEQPAERRGGGGHRRRAGKRRGFRREWRLAGLTLVLCWSAWIGVGGLVVRPGLRPSLLRYYFLILYSTFFTTLSVCVCVCVCVFARDTCDISGVFERF